MLASRIIFYLRYICDIFNARILASLIQYIALYFMWELCEIFIFNPFEFVLSTLKLSFPFNRYHLDFWFVFCKIPKSNVLLFPT